MSFFYVVKLDLDNVFTNTLGTFVRSIGKCREKGLFLTATIQNVKCAWEHIIHSFNWTHGHWSPTDTEALRPLQ